MLQTLDKEKGEALIFHNRLYPFIANLPDIDNYQDFSHDNDDEDIAIEPIFTSIAEI